MAEESGKSGNRGYGSGNGCGLGCLASLAGIASIVATLSLGPIDFGRSVYNQIIGDMPVLKQELVDYTRRGIQKEHPEYTPAMTERLLAIELGYKLETKLPIELVDVKEQLKKEDMVDPQKVSTEKLWDASEDHAISSYQRWVWPFLNE